MATHGLIIIEIKDDNELAIIISLPVYFKSVKKWKYVLSKKKGKQNNQKNSKKTFFDRSQTPNLRSAKSSHYLLCHVN